jgi:hypothetical protein
MSAADTHTDRPTESPLRLLKFQPRPTPDRPAPAPAPQSSSLTDFDYTMLNLATMRIWRLSLMAEAMVDADNFPIAEATDGIGELFRIIRDSTDEISRALEVIHPRVEDIADERGDAAGDKP